MRTTTAVERVPDLVPAWHLVVHLVVGGAMWAGILWIAAAIT